MFEAVLLLLLPQIPAGELVAAMLAYRFIYYILPLIAAAILLGGMGLPAVGRLSPKLNEAWQTTQAMLPQVLGVLTFLSGAVMLLSTATPAVATRMQFLHEVLPLSLVETSHLLSSGLGFALLVLGRGLFRRLNGAYWLSILALLAGVILSLLKGLDFEEAVALAAVLLLLIPARRAFYRRASLMTPSISPGWLVAMATVVLSTAWLGLASFRQVDLMSGLWFNFAFADDASRFLRASLVVAVLASCFALWRLLRGAAPEGFPDAGSADQAIREIVRGSDDPDAALALTGDKRFLVHESGHSMIMYGVAGRSWISMGDPLGPREEWEDLLWKFRELSDRYDGRIVFYQVGESSLRFYADAGLSVLKIGEEAVVSLPDFTLKGSARAKLRQAVARAERDGASFRVALPPHDEKLMNSLGEISDQWLVDKNAAEKRFSVGRFDPAYLASQPIALVEVGGDIVAFANIWASNPDGEFSIDLMRHTTGSPDGVMDYLFVSLIQWGRAQGFASFNLGMAPLSGLTSHPLAPTWQRLGAAIFRHGEYFYNFEGLRRYKEKFHPEWRPRYIATPPGLALPHMLLDVTKLISGGLRGIISR